jgi:hypothetical protein
VPEHGERDAQAQKWFCGYWMTQQEWEDIHDYSPAVAAPEPADDFQG